jgi:hypothetical protein
VKDRTWGILRDEGAIIEEAADDDDTVDEGAPHSFDEKVLAEKVPVDAPLAAVNLVPGATLDDLR